jgi:hypothetical protein
MKKLVVPSVAAAVAVAFGVAFLSWGGFFREKHLVGPYRLGAVDIDEQMSVYYDLGDGTGIGRINETVFAARWNDRYVVAKQHPKNDRTVTHYFYLEIARDSGYADPGESVTGPLSEAEFNAKKAELGLPDFTRVIKPLE